MTDKRRVAKSTRMQMGNYALTFYRKNYSSLEDYVVDAKTS